MLKIKKNRVLAFLAAAAFSLTSASAGVSSAAARENPWRQELLKLPPIKVLDTKADAVVSVAEGQEPVFELTIEDVGLYFGYIIPAHVAGYYQTKFALEELYPEGMPERGQIRVATKGYNDILLVASYLTGAREFYLIGGQVESDLVVDPSLEGEEGELILIFQRKDTGRTVRAVFDRTKLVSQSEYQRTAYTYVDLLNNKTPRAGTVTENRELMDDLMEKTLNTDPRTMISVEVIDDYTFPSSEGE